MIMQEPTGSLVHSYSPFPLSFLLKEPHFVPISRSQMFLEKLCPSSATKRESWLVSVNHGNLQFHYPRTDLSFSTGQGLVIHFWHMMFENKSVLTVAEWFQEKSFLLSKRNTWEKIYHSSMFYLLILYLLLMSVFGAGKNGYEPGSRN